MFCWFCLTFIKLNPRGEFLGWFGWSNQTQIKSNHLKTKGFELFELFDKVSCFKAACKLSSSTSSNELCAWFLGNWMLQFCFPLNLFFSELNRTCCLALQIMFMFSPEIANMSETSRISAGVFLFLQWRMDIKIKILSWSRNHRDTWGYLTPSRAYKQSSFQEKIDFHGTLC